MAKEPDRSLYIYCEKHDIFFNPKAKKKADETNAQLKEQGLLDREEACPICRLDFTLTVLKMQVPSDVRSPFCP